jgi:serine/threonine protein kinase
MALEYMDAGSLHDVMKRNNDTPLAEDVLAELSKQVLLGLRYLHKVRKGAHWCLAPTPPTPA